MKEEYVFWPFKVAEEIIKKFPDEKIQTIATGTSISGTPHIGNYNDVIRGHFIQLALEEMGFKSRLVWISDDMDPLRSVPQDLPQQLKEFLGIPVCNIPDLFGCHEKFTDHFEDEFLQSLKEVFVEPEVYLGWKMYKDGLYNETIKISIIKREEIIKILNKYRTSPLPDDWYPIDIICRNCGKIATTKILQINKENLVAKYICETSEKILHKKYVVRGCGYEDEISILNGNSKLTWRVEWPARWSFLRVTCEPFGKEHAASGGSWDTGKEIVHLFNWKPPHPLIYEHFLVEGEKMSKSKGNVLTLKDVLKYMMPEHLRYWMAQGKLTIAKDINLKSMVPRIFDEFNLAEAVYFGIKSTNDKRKDSNLKNAYKISVVNVKEKKPFEIPFNTIVELLKIYPESEIPRKLRELNYDFDEKELEVKIEKIKNWFEKFYKVEEKVEIDESTKHILRELIASIENFENEKDLEGKIFEIAKKSGDIKKFFEDIYKILFGIPKGPRLSKYILEVGKEKVLEKLRKYI